MCLYKYRDDTGFFYLILLFLQGEKVRALKTSGATKETVTPEVTILLNLKQQLAAAQGIDAAAGDKKKNKKGGAAVGGKENVKQSTPAAPASAQSSTPADEAEVSRLQALVTQQVRLL